MRASKTYPEQPQVSKQSQGRDPATEARDIVRRCHASAEGCRTATIAAQLGISASALCHRYRLRYDSTIGADVRRLRIERACRMLRADPDRLLKEVAAEVGYVHAAYRTFLNAFRRETGVAPTTYIAALRSGALHLLRRRPVGGADPPQGQSRICSA